MLDITMDIQSLTTFRRRSGDFMKQLKKSKRPVVLTVKGKAAAIVQDAEAYQRLLDIAARADLEEGIRQGLVFPQQLNIGDSIVTRARMVDECQSRGCPAYNGYIIRTTYN